jgi:hypothetical protein
MRRTGLALLVAAGALLLGGAAQAKAPPSGIEICGSSGCMTIAPDRAEVFWISSHDSGRPVNAGPYYILRWHWDAEPDRTAYFMPGARTVLWLDPRTWSRIQPQAAEVAASVTGQLEPYPAPTLTRVTIGRRVARAPQTYLSLLQGKPSWTYPPGPWLTVKLQSSAPTPWTNGALTVRLNRSRPYVIVDGWVFTIPKAVAVRARRGLSLRG